MARSVTAPTDAIAINAVLFAVRQAADVVCDRSALMLLIAALLGERRYNGFATRTGLASRTVASRLRTLEDLGLMVRMPYSVRPLRHEYSLSVMGQDFAQVVLQMMGWEQRQSDGGGAIPLVHALCGAEFQPHLRCAACGREAGARDIDLSVSQAQLRNMPVKQTLHRRPSSRGGGRDAVGGSAEMLPASLDIFGDKWGVEIIICAFLRVRRFGAFRDATGIAANILSDRLDRLVAAGIFRKDAPGGGPGFADYRLTEKGLDLFGILMALQDWADAWLRERVRSPVRFVHRACGQVFHAASACGSCDGRIDTATGILPRDRLPTTTTRN